MNKHKRIAGISKGDLKKKVFKIFSLDNMHIKYILKNDLLSYLTAVSYSKLSKINFESSGLLVGLFSALT